LLPKVIRITPPVSGTGASVIPPVPNQPGEMGLRVFREHHVARAGGQPVRRDEDAEIMRGAIVQLQPDTVRPRGHIGHLCMEP
jgi:hypothetical protein